FNGILRGSETPERDLERLGLDPAFAVLQGWEWYLDEYPIDVFSEEFDEGFFRIISKPRILMFYLSHPSRFLSVLQESAGYARFIRAPYLTAVQNPEYHGQQVYRFSLWESARIRLALLANFWFITFIIGLMTTVGIIKLVKIWRNKGDGEGLILPILLIVLAASAAGSFIIPYLSNGIADQAKQLFGFISLFDMIIFTLIGILVYRLDFMKILKALRSRLNA
ncbi:MAG: hypothetical protein FWD01_00995, partial [Defluviitaleaceae bacterium]|nr:hypothetical protein [Defluviitaleaceae bacterium]